MSPFQDHLLEHLLEHSQIFFLKLLPELLLHHYVLFMYFLMDGSSTLGWMWASCACISAVFSRNAAWLENYWNPLTVGQISMTSLPVDQEKE